MESITPSLCGKCGYDLTGLPRRGTCPECGQAFDRATGRGFKQEETPEAKAGRVFVRLRTIALGVLTVLSMGCGMGMWGCLGDPRWIGMGVVVAAILALGTATSYVYEKPET